MMSNKRTAEIPAEDISINSVEDAINTCEQMQRLINISAEGLIKLRDIKIETESVALLEIQELEAKMIRNYALQSKTKKCLKEYILPIELRQYPQLMTWLKVVGFSETSADKLSKRLEYMDTLLSMSDSDIKSVLTEFNCLNHADQLILALTKLRRYQNDDRASPDSDLYWSSSPHPATLHRTTSQLSTPVIPKQYKSPSLPHSTPVSPVPSPSHGNSRYKASKNATPPPHKRLNVQQPSNSNFPPPLHKSRSHESQLAARVANLHLDSEANRSKDVVPVILSNLIINGKTPRRRSAGDPEFLQRMASGQSSALFISKSANTITDLDCHKGQLIVPSSPKPVNLTQRRSMKHSINHLFHRRWVFNENCDHCSRKILTFGKMCKHCKKKFHSDCAAKTPQRSCGLPEEFLDFFMETNSASGIDSPSINKRYQNSTANNDLAVDSNSISSSCNSSSSSSSPAMFLTGASIPNTPSSTAQPSPLVHVTSDTGSTEAFQFPNYTDNTDFFKHQLPKVSAKFDSEIINTSTSNDSDKSDKTLIDSITSDKASNLGRFDSIESSEDAGHTFSRVNSISVALKEWDIPYDDLLLVEKIGEGQFGSVWSGHWHGQVAIKLFDVVQELDQQEQLRAFKLEVSTLRKTRHDNLVLFQGACMKPPRLAIVMSFCKGPTLYEMIHENKNKIPMSKAIFFASQIIQGLGYLHAKQIVHKDLKTKNIFLVNSNKIIISDFGLFSLTKLCNTVKKRRLGDVSWLSYLAPELLRSLYVGRHQMKAPQMPFSYASDIYAFGTVWYELICLEWPFVKKPAEVIIWQVGNGIKQPLTDINASKDVKELIVNCWKFEPSNRLEYDKIYIILQHLPKKRLARSPSHPVYLTRSAESVF